ncbi:MAG: TIGR02449 family protein [Candidatus Macondimonas sp.]|jgi:cell division protein ZapB
MSQSVFDRLESQVLALVQQMETLRRENAGLRLRLDQLATERANLMQKNELARSRIEAIVNRLKAMEHTAG